MTNIAPLIVPVTRAPCRWGTKVTQQIQSVVAPLATNNGLVVGVATTKVEAFSAATGALVWRSTSGA